MQARFALAFILWASLSGHALAGSDGGTESRLERVDAVVSIKELRHWAEQGDALSQSVLGALYYIGDEVQRDYAEALKWTRKAAEQGNTDAQNNLGAMYNTGHGVPQDYSEAVKWYRKAAEQGDPAGQHHLALMYAVGHGVPRDRLQAHMWFNLAASRFPPGEARDMAAKIRDALTTNMTPHEIAEAQRLAREWKPKQ